MYCFLFIVFIFDGVLSYYPLMSLQRRSHIKVSIVLTRAYHLCIHNYIRSLQNIILKPILMVRTKL